MRYLLICCKYFREFKGDENLMEIPMPSNQFNVGEIDCILEMAENLDLEAKVRGEVIFLSDQPARG